MAVKKKPIDKVIASGNAELVEQSREFTEHRFLGSDDVMRQEAGWSFVTFKFRVSPGDKRKPHHQLILRTF